MKHPLLARCCYSVHLCHCPCWAEGTLSQNYLFTLLLHRPLRWLVEITDCIPHCETLLWGTLSLPGYLKHAHYVGIIHQSEYTSAVLTVALCCSSSCKFDLSHVYCNWANRNFMSFISTLICYHICRFWRSNCEGGGGDRERDWGDTCFTN